MNETEDRRNRLTVLFGWITMAVLLVVFILMASWGRSFMGESIDPIVTSPQPSANTTTIHAHEDSMSLSVGATGSAPIGTAVRRQDEKGKTETAQPFDLPGFTVTDPSVKRRREQELQEYRDRVARETVEESVRNLLVFYPPPFGPSPGRDAITLTEYLKADPRTAKLLDIIEHGSPKDIDSLHGDLLAVIATYLNDLPLNQPIGEPPTPSVAEPFNGNAIPMLLASFPSSMEHLNLLVAMAERIDEAHEETIRAWPDSTPPRDLYSDSTMVLAYSADRILSGLADGDASKESYSVEQRAAIEEYVQYRSRQRTLAREFAQNMVNAGEFGSAEIETMQSTSYLDAMSWSSTFGVPSSDTDTYRKQEREIFVLARLLCSGITTQN